MVLKGNYSSEKVPNIVAHGAYVDKVIIHMSNLERPSFDVRSRFPVSACHVTKYPLSLQALRWQKTFGPLFFKVFLIHLDINILVNYQKTTTTIIISYTLPTRYLTSINLSHSPHIISNPYYCKWPGWVGLDQGLMWAQGTRHLAWPGQAMLNGQYELGDFPARNKYPNKLCIIKIK